MKRIIFSGLTGLALASLTAFNANADGKVTVVVLQSDGVTPLNGVTIRYQYGSGGTSTLLAGSAGGNEATRTLTTSGSAHKFTAAWKGTEYTLTLNRSVADNDTTIYFYTTGVTFHAKSGSTNIGNVSLRYTAGGSVTNQQGTTGVDGKYAIQMFPGTYTYHKGINSTLQSGSVTVGGNPLSSGTAQTENITVTKVNFHNAGTVKYPRQGSVDGTIGTDFYMIPGTYNLRFKTGSNPTYSRNVEISGDNFNKAAAVIRLKDHEGNPLSINSIRGGVASINWHVSANNGNNHVADGNPGVWIDISNYNANTSRIYEVTKNATISTQSQNILTNNIFDFQTNLLTLRLQNCNEDGLQGGSIRLGSSSDVNAVLNASNINRHWHSMDVTSNQTDANGYTSVEVFTGAFFLEMTYAASLQSKLVQFMDNDTIVWTTTKVKFKYPGAIAYGRGSISTHFPAAKEAELLPGAFKFRFSVESPNAQFPASQNIIDINIPEQCAYELTPFLLRFINSTNQAMTADAMQYRIDDTWYDAIPSSVAGNYVVLHEGLLTDLTNRGYRINYRSKTLTKDVLRINGGNAHGTTTGQKYVFQTIPATVTFKSSTGADLTGDLTVSLGGDVPFDTDPNASTSITGSKTLELLPINANYVFKLTHKHLTQTKSHNFTTNGSTAAFATRNILFSAVDANDGLLSNTHFRYRTSSSASAPWYTLSEVNDGTHEEELLPVSVYQFRAVYGSNTLNKGFNVNLATNDELVFNFTNVNVPMLPMSGNFDLSIAEVSLYPNPAVNGLYVKVNTVNQVDVEVYSVDGRKVYQNRYENGMFMMDVTNLAEGTYLIRMNYDNKTETRKFIKK